MANKKKAPSEVRKGHTITLPGKSWGMIVKRAKDLDISISEFMENSSLIAIRSDLPVGDNKCIECPEFMRFNHKCKECE